MLDLYIYNSNITKQKKFYLLYGIYAVCFLGLCSLINVVWTLSFVIKGLAVTSLFTLGVVLQSQAKPKLKAVMQY